MRPELSVVIPVRDGARFLPELLEALEAQTLDRFETIVVDDGSTDATPELLASWADGERRRTAYAGGRGPAHARNAGVRIARGRWIVFTDCDTLPEPGWLEAFARASDGAAALEGSVVPWPPGAAAAYTHQIANETGGKFVTANMAYRRDLLERLGGFDERFRQPFLEDSDLAFRALDAGVEIVFVPEARVRHRVLPMSARATFRAARRLAWLPLFAAKHPRRYRAQLRPHVRVLSDVDVRVLAGVAALATVPFARGTLRLAALAVAVDGVRVGAGRARAGGSLLLSFVLPAWKGVCWLDGLRRRRG